jgi:hypothetical protein
LGASEISMIKKDDRAVRKPKGKRAQETQMLEGMPKSLKKKVTSKIKWIYPSKAKKKAAKPKKSGKRKDERHQKSNY